MKYKIWNQAPSAAAAARVMEGQGVHPLVASVLCARGLDTLEKAGDFLASDASLLCAPELLKDMDKAVARIRAALARGEKMAVYGDYDVDGITATCLLAQFLREEGGDVVPYIPDRMEEGYGLNREAVAFLREKGVSLIITVDCGITAVEETLYAGSLGMDVIITDHHECKDALPAACAVVDPRRSDCGYPFKALAGVGVALKLALALAGPARHGEVLDKYADLTAIGTVADVMCLLGENRAIVRMGLESMENSKRPGLRALLREAGMENKAISASTIGYMLAPRLNAAGRICRASVAAKLLLTKDPVRAGELAQALCGLNRERQCIEREIFENCVSLVERDPAFHRHVIVLSSTQWHQGVVG
ncbi:MAG: single-stranded-DNA-specific exonuclease RecJ, partial [Clostridiales bacterium]|nr:single-stranded-DNA-specific exonuclease RecJ [Clostridiales bacterium]